jgi:hypothetical protein
MPRIKPPREQDPRNVEIELEPEGTVIVENNDTPDALTELATDTEAQRESKKEAAREYRRQKKAEDEARAAETNDLKKQLEDMRAAVEEGRKQAQEVQRQQAEAQRRLQEATLESSQYLSRAEEAEYQAVLTAMGAAESESESAQRDYEVASANGDFKAATDAQKRLARAEAKLIQLEDGKNVLEQRKNAAIAKAEEAKKNPPPQQNLTVEQQIDSVSALLPSQKEWLKAHPDAWTDQRKNMRLQGAHVEAEDKGLTPGSKKYFQYLEERLGYKEAEEEIDDDEEIDDEPTPRRQTARKTLVSAPVSREAPTNSGKPSRTKITLTPKQQEAAAIAGITQQEYAKNLMRLQDMKEEGYYDN